VIFTYNLQKIELGTILALFTRLTSYGFASDSVLVEWLLILFLYLGNILNMCYRISIYIMLRNCLDNMKTDELLVTMIVAAAILATPSVLTSSVLAQVPPGTDTGRDGTTDTADENQGTTGGTTADESPSDMYQSFQSCLETAEGTETFATEDEIRDCFIEAGFTGAGDDNQDENENEDDEDENENEDDEETN
jgi:hypothetical protein